MRNLKLSGKYIGLMTILAAFFNYMIDAGSTLGIFSLLVTFIYMGMWVNYIVYKLSDKSEKKSSKIISEIYFTITALAALLLLASLIFKFSLGTIAGNVIGGVLAPLNGIRFLLRPVYAWIIVAFIITLLFIFMIRGMTDEDDPIYNEFREENKKEDNEEE